MSSNKDKILAAASELLLSKGPTGLSVRAIATLAGVSTIGIYSHFQGKQGILNALYIEGYERMYEAMAAACEIDDPKQAMMVATENYLRFASTHEAKYRLIFGESDDGFEPSEEAKAISLAAFEKLIEIASKALPASAKLPLKQQTAMRFWALIHGYVSLQHHAVKDALNNVDWHQQILTAMEDMYDSLASK